MRNAAPGFGRAFACVGVSYNRQNAARRCPCAGSGTRRPASYCFTTAMTCSSLYRFLLIGSPLPPSGVSGSTWQGVSSAGHPEAADSLGRRLGRPVLDGPAASGPCPRFWTALPLAGPAAGLMRSLPLRVWERLPARSAYPRGKGLHLGRSRVGQRATIITCPHARSAPTRLRSAGGCAEAIAPPLHRPCRTAMPPVMMERAPRPQPAAGLAGEVAEWLKAAVC